MNEHSPLPRFKSDTYSERCVALFHEDQQWEEYKEVDSLQWKRRAVTWAHYPYRYWVEQDGVESPRFFRRNTIVHKMFQVALLSAQHGSDGSRELERWYIVYRPDRSEQILHFSQLVDTPEIENMTGEANKNFDFTLNNGLFVPNSEDILQLDQILELGELDGCNPLRIST